jgi:hypothetical protein
MGKRELVLFVAGSLVICSAALAGPIDNANEFVDKAVEEAEERNNPPTDQSADSASIGWENDASGTDSAVNTGTADTAANDQQTQ